MKRLINYSLITASISLIVSIYLTYNLIELIELIQLLREDVKEIKDNLPTDHIKNDNSTASIPDSNSLFTNKNITYLCLGISVIVLSIGAYYYFHDVTPINDITINNVINIKTDSNIRNERLNDLLEYLSNISNELITNLEDIEYINEQAKNDICDIIKN
jgi:hypothetical protein